jgi:hypothetical protein
MSLLLLVGCTTNETKQSNDVNETTVADGTNVANATNETEHLTPEQESPFSVATKQVTEGNIIIDYPQLQDFPGELTMDYINQDIEGLVNTFLVEDNGTQNELHISYEVTCQDNDILSILFKGEQKYEDGTYTFLSALNFDLKTSNKINASNFLKEDMAIEEVNTLFSEAIEKDPSLETSTREFADWMGMYFTKDAVVFYYLENDYATDYTFVTIPLDLIKPYVKETFGQHPAS